MLCCSEAARINVSAGAYNKRILGEVHEGKREATPNIAIIYSLLPLVFMHFITQMTIVSHRCLISASL